MRGWVGRARSVRAQLAKPAQSVARRILTYQERTGLTGASGKKTTGRNIFRPFVGGVSYPPMPTEHMVIDLNKRHYTYFTDGSLRRVPAHALEHEAWQLLSRRYVEAHANES